MPWFPTSLSFKTITDLLITDINGRGVYGYIVPVIKDPVTSSHSENIALYCNFYHTPLF